MTASSSPVLSAIMVAGGAHRSVGQGVLDALAAQTIAGEIEVVVVDVAADRLAALQVSHCPRVIYLPHRRGSSYVEARLVGLRAATAPVVAFIEDHCFPEADWAERLVEAHRGPWAAVGYGIGNANPETYIGRVSAFIDYGPWSNLAAAPGPTTVLPGNNISFKREALRAFEDDLAGLLSPDQVILEAFTRRGFPLYLEPRARAVHMSFTHFAPQLRANYSYGRLHAAKRAQAFAWPLRRRIYYGLLSPFTSPVLRTLHAFRLARGRPAAMHALVEALPVAWCAFVWGALGSSAGYLFGPGSSERALTRLDLESSDTERQVSG